MSIITLSAHYYRQFDADLSRDVPGEGYGGWQKADLEFSLDHAALVIMHAWDTGTPEEYPGWYRAVEYLPRANEILRTVFPPLLAAARRAGLTIFHVVSEGAYYRHYPGYRRALELAVPTPPSPPRIASDPTLDALRQWRRQNVFPGPHNEVDIKNGFARLDFPSQARPAGAEGIAENAPQLFGLCREDGINHLIYAGFAINWCLHLSPGGMAEMTRHGILCSALRQAVTAVENKESAREQWCKELALWRVALDYGFVFDVPDFIAALAGG
jgi:hypothetical protein